MSTDCRLSIDFRRILIFAIDSGLVFVVANDEPLKQVKWPALSISLNEYITRLTILAFLHYTVVDERQFNTRLLLIARDTRSRSTATMAIIYLQWSFNTNITTFSCDPGSSDG